MATRSRTGSCVGVIWAIRVNAAREVQRHQPRSSLGVPVSAQLHEDCVFGSTLRKATSVLGVRASVALGVRRPFGGRAEHPGTGVCEEQHVEALVDPVPGVEVEGVWVGVLEHLGELGELVQLATGER